MALFRNVKEPLGSKALLEEVGRCGRKLEVYQAIFTACFLSTSCSAEIMGGEECQICISDTMASPLWNPFNQSQTKPFLQLFPVLPVRKITNMLPYPHSPAYISILLLGQSWRKDTITWHSLDAYLGLQCFPTEPTEIQTVSIASDPLCPFPELLFCTCLMSSFMRTLLIREWTWHCRVWLTHCPPPNSYSSPSWTTKTSSIVTGYYFK